MALINPFGELSLEATQNFVKDAVQSISNKTPDQVGSWGYLSGLEGNATVPANAKVLQITAVSNLNTESSLTINAGQVITIPLGQSLTIEPKGNLIAPSIAFEGTASYFVEYVI